MGLLEQFITGYTFERTVTSITTGAGNVSGSVSGLGYSYVLLNIGSSAPSRVRLYSDSASVALDSARAATTLTLGDTVGLVIDAEITANELSLGIDPPLIGTVFGGSSMYYNISSSAGVTVQLITYPIEQITSSRQLLTITGSNIISGTDGVTGNVTSPKSFLMLSASATTQSRLRLYSNPIEQIALTEINRAFGVAASSSAHLISDMLFESASVGYKLVPLLQGFNLQTYGSGQNSVGYILQNQSNAASVTATASIYLYSLEN